MFLRSKRNLADLSSSVQICQTHSFLVFWQTSFLCSEFSIIATVPFSWPLMTVFKPCRAPLVLSLDTASSPLAPDRHEIFWYFVILLFYSFSSPAVCECLYFCIFSSFSSPINTTDDALPISLSVVFFLLERSDITENKNPLALRLTFESSFNNNHWDILQWHCVATLL